MNAAAEIVECTTCARMFRDTKGDRVCPEGHENNWATDEDEQAEHLKGLTW